MQATSNGNLGRGFDRQTDDCRLETVFLKGARMEMKRIWRKSNCWPWIEYRNRRNQAVSTKEQPWQNIAKHSWLGCWQNLSTSAGGSRRANEEMRNARSGAYHTQIFEGSIQYIWQFQSQTLVLIVPKNLWFPKRIYTLTIKELFDAGWKLICSTDYE